MKPHIKWKYGRWCLYADKHETNFPDTPVENRRHWVGVYHLNARYGL